MEFIGFRFVLPNLPHKVAFTHQLMLPITDAVLKPIIYGDLFSYPLTAAEIRRFMEQAATRGEIADALAANQQQGRIGCEASFYCLVGRETIIEQRLNRQQAAEKLWSHALGYGRTIAALPFVLMVAVTGSLAVNNPRHGEDDIDFLVVTQPGRLWLCRALIIALVRYGHQRGVHLCPNYLITTNATMFDSHDLYMAREMVQMVPLYGQATYEQLWQDNGWVQEYLPQSQPLEANGKGKLSKFGYWGKCASEWMLQGRFGNQLEHRLQRWQINKHRRQASQRAALDHVQFTPDQCKGHYDSHGNKTMQAYRELLQKYGL